MKITKEMIEFSRCFDKLSECKSHVSEECIKKFNDWLEDILMEKFPDNINISPGQLRIRVYMLVKDSLDMAESINSRALEEHLGKIL